MVDRKLMADQCMGSCMITQAHAHTMHTYAHKHTHTPCTHAHMHTHTHANTHMTHAHTTTHTTHTHTHTHTHNTHTHTQLQSLQSDMSTVVDMVPSSNTHALALCEHLDHILMHGYVGHVPVISSSHLELFPRTMLSFHKRTASDMVPLLTACSHCITPY